MLGDVKNSLVQEIVKRSFYLCNLYEYRKVVRADTKNNKILIYQMGKVASTSLYKTLRNLNLDASIYHLHVLQPSSIDRVMKSYRRRFLHTPRIDEHIIHSQYLRKLLDKGLRTSEPKWKIITLVRDPVARNISEFFQRLPHQSGTIELESGYGIDANLRSLIQEYFQIYDDKPHPFTWLDLELSAVFDVDIPFCDFPRTSGFKVYRFDHIDLLILKLEQLSDCVEDALADFLDLQKTKKIKLVTANEASKKKQGELYERFKELIEFSPDYLDRMYKNSHLENIYDQDQIEKFYWRWQADR